MAYGVLAGERMKLQQALHGYSDGHRELAASVTLNPSEIKSMLVLSDISGPGVVIDEAGYLTGYPLAEFGVYVIARTWTAPEMPRPGCVWTHSILIEFADLATLASLSGLVSLFRRPRGSYFGDYGKPLTFVSGRNAMALTDAEKAWSRRILAGLYDEPSSSVIAARPPGVDVDRVILAVWSQQWPRLRRSFRFCTLATADRSSEGSNFDLQLLPSLDRSVRIRFPDSIDAETAEPHEDSWLVEASTDLTHPDASGLRTFLRRIGSDGAMGRWTFGPLCRLHQLVENFGARHEAVCEAIALLQDELSSVQARTARGIVASAALGQAGELNGATLDFLLRHLELVETGDVVKGAERFGRAVWSREPDKLIPLLEGGDTLRMIPQRTFKALSLRELAEGLRRVPALAQAALTYRPELVTEPAFWSQDLRIEDDAFAVVARLDEEVRSAALAALVAAQRDDLATRAVGQFRPSAVLDVVGSALEHDCESRGLDRWLSAVANDPSAVSQYLATGSEKPRALLVALARAVPPDVVPNEIGADPWLIATQGAIGSVSEGSSAYLNAYLLNRALGHRSRSAAELAQLGFETVHMAVASDRLSNEAWQLLEARLPSSIFCFEWDRCQRIRTAIVGLFVDRNLAPQVFARIATDDELFMDLAEVLARNGRGRRYLKRVRRAMKNESQSEFAVRIRRIEKLLH